jgi:SPP1 family predicted phage head-tail adaptor
MTEIGKLNKRITLQYPTRTKDKDGLGGWTETWTDSVTVSAKKTTHRSDEAIQAMQTTGFAVHNFRIRHRSGIDSTWRVKEGSVYMPLIGPPILVEEGVGGRWLDLTCKEAL